MSTIRFLGLLFSASLISATLYAQRGTSPEVGIASEHPAHAVSPFSAPLRSASGENTVGDEYPLPSGGKPIAGFVSLHDLEHPVKKKALEEAYRAQQLARANHLPKASAKLEHAIRIDPEYRDAHWNLGVEYARAGRNAEAKSEFQKALKIGPPAAILYADLALTSLALGERQEAESMARKALQLDPASDWTARAERIYAIVLGGLELPA